MRDGEGLQFQSLDERDLERLAGRLAPRLRSGDFLALHGDLGAGKTAFARYLIRALTENPDEEVPSPTFTLVQLYETARFPVHHFDFYRLSSPEETGELGLDDACASGLVIAEWPERLGPRLPADRLEIRLEDTGEADRRRVTLRGAGSWGARAERFAQTEAFIRGAGWEEAAAQYVNGDASARSYARLTLGGRTALLMDAPEQPDGPPIRDGKPYSRIAHLAENVKPFIAVAAALRAAGLAAPEIHAQDEEAGLLLIEDFGDLTFTRLAEAGEDLAPLYRLAVDALLRLRVHPPAAELAARRVLHRLPDYDAGALSIETELLPDWLLPALTGKAPSADSRAAFAALWSEQFTWLATQPAGWVLRDFHSPNLLLRPAREGLARLGVIDFQDAMRGHPAYDLVSLLQDARLDLPEGLEDHLLGYYLSRAAALEASPGESAFLRAYRLLGAQRATKILGIFARLARRDAKPGYLRHLPRIANYLWANLEDPHLAALKSWYERETPRDMSALMKSL